MSGLLVVAGALLGAPLRYALAMRHDKRTILSGVFIANVAGSFVLGVGYGIGMNEHWYLLVAAGFCGALTTWSSLAYDVFVLIETRSFSTAGVYLLTSVTVGFVALRLGVLLA